MKNIFTIIIGLLLTASVFAQAPEKMSYQAVVRDASNNLTTNQTIGMQISILQGSLTGTPVYVETQAPTTNANGLVSLEIGTGTVISGDFATIDWANSTYFIKTETDPTTGGGTNYTITGTTQLLSVPYALHANTADSITGTINYTETDPVFTASIANGITALDTANWNNHTVDTDTHIDSTGIAGLGYVAGGIASETDPVFAASIANGITALDTANWNNHTVDTDTHIDSTGIAGLGYVAGAHTVVIAGTNVTVTGAGTTASPYVVNALSGSSIDKFYLGQDTLGGIVYYITKDASGTQHGLIVNKTESIKSWQASATITLADRPEDGAYNTALMVNSQAAAYVTGLGSGWYLPSVDEMNLLYNSRFTVNRALRAGAFTLLGNSTYWTSMESMAARAWRIAFSTGELSTTYKSYSYWVRAVRAF